MRDVTTRPYYDHEPAYQDLAARGRSGWSPPDNLDATRAFRDFLASSHWRGAGPALDLGCGGGELCIELQRLGRQVVGVEYSRTALRLAQLNARRADSMVKLVRADLTRPLPLCSSSFDLVVDNHVLHCLIELTHRAAFLKNVRDALTRTGVFFSANMSCEGQLDYGPFDIDPETRINRSRTRKWSSCAELKEEFSAAGLDIFFLTMLPPLAAPHPGDEIVIYARRI